MNANGYIDRLFEIICRAEITDNHGQVIEFNAGFEQMITLLKSQNALGKKILFIGNGGSAAIASHETIDFWKNGKMKAMCFNEAALLTCMGNDYGYAHVFEKPVEMFGDPGDILVAISSSGKSENILLAVEAARKQQCKVITFSGFSSENPLRKTGDLNLYINSGSYGFVELGHQIVLHMVLDMIMGINDEDVCEK